jgi:betaine-homocysteine S-methyltransferase
MAIKKPLPKTRKSPGLLERLAVGPVICAEGYLFEFERRGYLQAGAYVPEVVLEHPDLVEGLHRDFVRAGSDVVEAFTYYAHRAKLRMVGRQKDLAKINQAALAVARRVARDTGTLLAGDICNTSIYASDDPASHKQARRIFDEQIGWAVDAGVDFIVGETYSWGGEALLALQAIKRAGKPAVVTLSVPREGRLREGWTAAEACKRLQDGGADVVGLNCARGPATTLPLLREVRAAVTCHVAALPVPYRTTPAEPTFQSLTDPHGASPDGRPFPTGLDPFLCSRYEIAEFGREALALGARYLGVCCGAGPHHIRSLAEALGRRPPASRYSPDMSKHILFGSDKRLRQDYLEYARRNYRSAPPASG